MLCYNLYKSGAAHVFFATLLVAFLGDELDLI